MPREFTVIIEQDEEGYYVASCHSCTAVIPRPVHWTS